jgi:hypothetical protein
MIHVLRTETIFLQIFKVGAAFACIPLFFSGASRDKNTGYISEIAAGKPLPQFQIVLHMNPRKITTNMG